MRTLLLWAAFAASITAVAGSGAFAEEEGSNPYAELLKSKSPALVSVKFVMKIEMMGQSQEMNRELTGVMVDPVGLVMVSNTQLGAGMRIRGRRGMGGGGVKASKFKIAFPGEDKEFDAIKGASDSKLNLAFLRIKNLEGRKVEFVDFAKAAPVKVGQELVGVDRYGKGFDYAPHFNLVRVAGEIKQPRVMYAVAGGGVAQGLPLFDTKGRVAGAIASQSGAEGADEGGGIGRLLGIGGGGRVFLIPADAVKSTIDAAKKQAEEALKKASEDGDGEKDEGDEGEEDEGGDEDEGW